LHFSAGAVGFKLGSELRSIGFVSLCAERGESGNGSDGEEAGGVVHDENPWKLKSVSKKPGQKTIPEPGSVSRLAGSAHRWVELYAGEVQRKTTESQTNCSSIGNNELGTSVADFVMSEKIASKQGVLEENPAAYLEQ
jgi:hypothetical protein